MRGAAIGLHPLNVDPLLAVRLVDFLHFDYWRPSGPMPLTADLAELGHRDILRCWVNWRKLGVSHFDSASFTDLLRA